jgi:hypothetical protein
MNKKLFIKLLITCTVFIVIFALLFVSCSKKDVSDQSHLYQKINKQKLEINGLKSEIKILEDKLLAYEKGNGTPKSDHDKFIEEYPIITEEWNSLSICKGDGPTVVIKDKQTINNFKMLLQNVRKLSEEESIAITKKPIYCYTVIENGERLEMYPVGNGIVRIDNKFYDTNASLEQLGNAFYNKPSYMEDVSPLLKIAMSGYVEVSVNEKEFGTFSPGIMKAIATELADGKELANTDDIDSMLAKATFYFFDEKITVELYYGAAVVKKDNDIVVVKQIDALKLVELIKK